MRFLLVFAIAVAVASFGTSSKAAPDQTKPEQVKVVPPVPPAPVKAVKPDQAKPDQVKVAKPDQAKPDQVKLVKPDQAKPDQVRPDQVKRHVVLYHHYHHEYITFHPIYVRHRHWVTYGYGKA
jgi:hypothetical protein